MALQLLYGRKKSCCHDGSGGLRMASDDGGGDGDEGSVRLGKDKDW